MSAPISALTERMNFGSFTENARMPLSNHFANIRPLREFFDFRRVSKPANVDEVESRCNYNLSYFSSNYVVIFVLLSIYPVLTNILLPVIIIMAVGGRWAIGRLGDDLVLGSTTVPSSHIYLGLKIGIVTTTAVLGPVFTILWICGASGVIIIGHASFMDKPIENALSEEAV